MEWIKRNLFFVISCVVAVVLAVAAVMFATSKLNEDKTIQEELNQVVADANRVHSAPVFPSNENIAKSKKDEKRLNDFRLAMLENFAPSPKFPLTGDQAFTAFLIQNISALTSEAAKAGVAIPTGYGFTFDRHRHSFKFATNDIEVWMSQMMDIRMFADVLYKAKVNALDGIQRIAQPPPAGAGEGLDQGAEFLAASVVTNQGGTTFTPYVINFRSFNSELASVLEAFCATTNFIIVKTVTVAPATVQLSTAVSQPIFHQQVAQVAQRAMSGEVVSDEAARYGLSVNRPTRQPTAPSYAATTSTAKPASATTVLSERLLQITIMLEVVRLSSPLAPQQ